jgi:hypothetical protein
MFEAVIFALIFGAVAYYLYKQYRKDPPSL